MTERRFVSYAHEEFSVDQLARFAGQYDGFDVAALKGASEDRFPFLVRSESHPLGYDGCWWNPYCGITIEMNDDSVEDYSKLFTISRTQLTTLALLAEATPKLPSFDRFFTNATHNHIHCTFEHAAQHILVSVQLALVLRWHVCGWRPG